MHNNLTKLNFKEMQTELIGIIIKILSSVQAALSFENLNK